MELNDGGEGDPLDDIPKRPMRVKVLYTFDADNNTNCLARFPETLQVPVVQIEENVQVGVIQLKQCLHAVVTASPELVSRISERDFTIYAYDYSEHETPLVGQGMLSAALNAASINASVSQGNTMITGRVCKNVAALFSKGVKETLEVKLRLVPVAIKSQDLDMRLTDINRSLTPATSAGFDPNAWITNPQQSRPFQSQDTFMDLQMGMARNQQDSALMDDIFGFSSASSGSSSGQQVQGYMGTSQTPTDAIFESNPAFTAHSYSAPGSRAGSPIVESEYGPFNSRLRHQSFSISATKSKDQSRPGSRASVRSEVQASRPRLQSNVATQSLPQQSESYYNEDGQTRKRAKVTQADWRGKSSFGSRTSELRVTAAKAASLEMHRPVPTRPSIPGNNLEPPPRVPTPVPRLDALNRQRGRISVGSKSLLRQASTASSDWMSDIDQMSEAIASSPEEDSPGRSLTAEGTPQDIPSSPPVFPGTQTVVPSSPVLPTLPPRVNADSGYMSERNIESSAMFDNLDLGDDECTPAEFDFEDSQSYFGGNGRQQPFVKSEWPAVSQSPPSYPMAMDQSNINMDTGPLRVDSTRRNQLSNNTRTRVRQHMQSQNASRAHSPLPPLAPALPQANVDSQSGSRRGSLALPSMPPCPSDQVTGEHEHGVYKKRPSAQRMRPSSGESEAGSPAPSDTEGRPSGPRRSGSGAPRRKIIQQRLRTALAKGEMPQYCTHCGAIETPTWRRLYVKHVDGKPSPLDSVEAEGETIGVEALEWDDMTGEVSKFVIRKSMKKTKDMQPGKGFVDTQLCNPCGLWFSKTREMRPAKKWGRKSGTRRSRKEKTRSGEAVIMTDGLEPQSEAFFTDGPMPDDIVDDRDSPSEDQSAEQGRQGSREPHQTIRARSFSVEPKQLRRSSDGSQWQAAKEDAGLARATQSSPVRFQGTQDSPIELDDKTPKPTRRLLFPSPRSGGEPKTLDTNTDMTGEKSMELSAKTISGSAALDPEPVTDTQTNLSVFEAFTFEKENMPPPLSGDDDLAHLFDGSPSALFKTPGRTPLKRSPRLIEKGMKTPTPASRKRKALSPRSNNVEGKMGLNATANDFMTSPSSSRYFLRSTPTRLANTPGRRSQGSGGRDGRGSQHVSPFSRQLAEMLSDANDGGIAFNSPSRAFDFSDLPTFTTPGRQIDWDNLDDILSSEFGAFNNGEAAARADKAVE